MREANSLVGITAFRDQVVNLLGGLTYEQAEEQFRNENSLSSPNFNFSRYHGLNEDKCRQAVFSAVSVYDAKPKIWNIQDRRYGLSFLVKGENGKPVHGNASCFLYKLSSHPRDTLTIILVTGTSQFEGADSSSIVNSIMSGIRGSFNEDDYIEDYIVSPFEYRLDKFGSFLIKDKYLGEDIVLHGTENMPNMGNISRITLAKALKAYRCIQEVAGANLGFTENYPDDITPTNDGHCSEYLDGY